MPIIGFHPFSDKTSSFAEPPKPASKSMPEWYRQQPAVVNEKTDYKQGNIASTIKRCMPIFDATSIGYVITAPCDIYVNTTNPEELTYSVPRQIMEFKADLFSTHAAEQYSEYPIDTNRYHKQLLRIQPFWSVETPKGYSSLFMNPLHRPGPLFAFAGVIDTDGYISEGHLSFLVEKDFDGIIKQGTPLVQVVPFKREEWESQVFTEEQSMPKLRRQAMQLRSVFQNAYKTKFRSKKEYK
jgi:hypothetical protein